MSKKDNHRIYINGKGEIVPSVTTILNILNKPKLIGWANYMGFKHKNVKSILNDTSYIGTVVHDLIARSFKYKIVSFKKYKDNKEIMNAFNAFLKWKKDYSVTVEEFELPLTCLKYGGTLDCLAIIEDKSILIDFKTSSKIHPTMFLQLGGYLNLLTEHGYNVDMVGITRLDKNTGTYEFLCQPVEYLQEYIDLFNKLVDVYKEWTHLLEYDWGELFDS